MWSTHPSMTMPAALHPITTARASLDHLRQMLPDNRIGGRDLLDSPFQRFAYGGARPFWHIVKGPTSAPKATRRGEFVRQCLKLFLLVC